MVFMKFQSTVLVVPCIKSRNCVCDCIDRNAAAACPGRRSRMVIASALDSCELGMQYLLPRRSPGRQFRTKGSWKAIAKAIILSCRRVNLREMGATWICELAVAFLSTASRESTTCQSVLIVRCHRLDDLILGDTISIPTFSRY